MVEEVLLNEVVVRFRAGVETQRLAAVPTSPSNDAPPSSRE